MPEQQRTMQVRGSLDLEKIKAAQVLGGEAVRFEMRAMKPVRAGQASSSCIVCLICIVCIVCSVAVAKEHNIRLRSELKG